MSRIYINVGLNAIKFKTCILKSCNFLIIKNLFHHTSQNKFTWPVSSDELLVIRILKFKDNNSLLYSFFLDG